ncbi:MAG: phage head closure protein [Anaerolineaceae bacterium]|nr:phage head closure protein [Anaerolineaceae bacterium]MDD5367515.1 phage head closure protein [Anaerolineaceae bacterium]
MNLNGKVTNPGELRTLVQLQSRTVSVETGGFPVPTWTKIADVWAKWVNVHGSEAWAAQSIEAEAAATVTIRHRNGIDTTCAVLLGTERYEIVSIDNIQQRNEYLELKVRQMKAG